MPLTKWQIEPSYLLASSQQGSELTDFTNAMMTSLVRQLSCVCRYADDMFTELAAEANLIVLRSNQLSERVMLLKKYASQLSPNDEDEVPVEKIYGIKPFKSAAAKGMSWSTRLAVIKQVHDLAEPPPALQKLNCFRMDGKDTLKSYTNPIFFFELWCSQIQKEVEKKKPVRKKARKKEVDKENINKKLQRKIHDARDREFRDTDARPSAPPPRPPSSRQSVKDDDSVVRRQTIKDAPPPVPNSPKPMPGVGYGSEQRTSGSGRPPAPPPPPTDNMQSLPPPPPTPAWPSRAPSTAGSRAPPPPITANRESILPPPPPVPTSAKPAPALPSSDTSDRIGSVSSEDMLPPPPTPPSAGVSGAAKRKTARLSRITMPPPRMSVCLIDTNFAAVSEEDEMAMAMPPPPPPVMAPPPPPPPPPPELSLPPPPQMESGFVQRSEPARQTSQKKCESRGDLLVAIRKGIELRKVEERRKDESRDNAGGGSGGVGGIFDVQKILDMRRKAMESDDDDDDDVDDDDEYAWDD